VCEQATCGVRDQYVRPQHASLFEQSVQLPYDQMTGARPRPEIAPTASGTIIGTDAGKTRDLRLHKTPIDREIACACLKDYGRLLGAGLSGAIEMETPAAEVDQPARRRKGRRSGCRLSG
jgi:hypothetical protein